MGQDQSVPKGLGPPRTGAPAPAPAKSAVSLRPSDSKPTPPTPNAEKKAVSPKKPTPEALEPEKPRQPAKDVVASPKTPTEARKQAKTSSSDSKSSKPVDKPKHSVAKPSSAVKEETKSRSLLPVSAKSSSSASKKTNTKIESASKPKAASRSIQTTLVPKKAPKPDDSDEEDGNSRNDKSAVEADEVEKVVGVTWTEPTAIKAEGDDIFVLSQAHQAPAKVFAKKKAEDINPIIPNFTLGAYYRRKDIIARYKGQSMSGIVTPANARYLFIFSSAHETAESNPYVDGWRGDQFWYTGEGLKGDQRMLKGNYQIRYHKQLRKHIYLFQKANTKETLHRYVGEFKCISTRVVDGMDSENRPRKEFKFILVRQAAYEALSDKEEIEEAPLPPSRFNKNETLPGYLTLGKRFWRTHEHQKPTNCEVVAETDALRPELGSLVHFGIRQTAVTKGQKRIFKATKVSTAPASRDFTPSGKGSYMGKLLDRPSVYDGTDGPEELDLVGVEYQEPAPTEQKPKQKPKVTAEDMKKKRQREKQQLLIKTITRAQNDDDDEDAPPAKRVKRNESDQ